MKYNLFFIFIICTTQHSLTSEPKEEKPFFYQILDILPSDLVKLFDPITPTSTSWSINKSQSATPEEIELFAKNKANRPTPTLSREESEQHDATINNHSYKSYERTGMILGATFCAAAWLLWSNQ